MAKAEYNGKEYGIKDVLPIEANIWVRYKGNLNGYKVYPNKGENLIRTLSHLGENVNNIAEWWID